MPDSPDGAVALISGANRGIGAAVARELAAAWLSPEPWRPRSRGA